MRNRFPKELNNLLELTFSGFTYTEATIPTCFFLPNAKYPSNSVQILKLPDGDKSNDASIMQYMLQIFPEVTQFEMNYSPVNLPMVFRHLVKLRKLTLHLKECMEVLDEILMGDSVTEANNDEAESCNRARDPAPSISALCCNYPSVIFHSLELKPLLNSCV